MARPYLTLERLPELSIEQLRREWARHYGAPAPALSVDLLRMGLGYRMQERRFGGLSRYAREVLSAGGERGRHAIRTLVRLTPGTRLVRDWHGVGHTVAVLNDGFEYGGKRWTSLTAIAFAITGSKRSGPEFFGLVEKGR